VHDMTHTRILSAKPFFLLQLLDQEKQKSREAGQQPEDGSWSESDAVGLPAVIPFLDTYTSRFLNWILGFSFGNPSHPCLLGDDTVFGIGVLAHGGMVERRRAGASPKYFFHTYSATLNRVAQGPPVVSSLSFFNLLSAQ